jgi:hypothetical protein
MVVSLVALAGVMWSARQARSTTLESAEKSRDATIIAANEARDATLKVAFGVSKNAERSEWFRRFEAMSDLALSDNERKAVLGIGMLEHHKQSALAGAEEKELCDLAVEQLLVRPLGKAGVDDPTNEAGTSHATFVIEGDQRHEVPGGQSP